MSVSDYAPRVQELVGAIIAKPAMKEKLLSKPPFRFLHDTVMAIMTATGFAQGLYDEEEMNSQNITDKPGKVKFLKTIFTMVGHCKGYNIDVDPLKVVAGLEAQNTCMFLIALAECATDSSIDSGRAVAATRRGDAPGAAEAKGESKEASPMRGDSADDKGGDADFKADVKGNGGPVIGPPEGFGIDEAQSQERGKSRSGTRGSKPNANAAGANGAGLFGTGGGMESNRPADLDEHIERCNGDVAVTQSIVSPIVERPRLTEKLLNKPPFRFLHDLIMAIIKATGFGEHLYSDVEADSGQVTSKEAKMAFLEKMIKMVGIQLNTIVDAKPIKIVAGADPQNTNVFLQLLGVAASKMPDSYESVKTVREMNGESMPPRTDGPGRAADNERREVFSPAAEAKRNDQRSSPSGAPGSTAGAADEKGQAPAGGAGGGGDDKSGDGGEQRSMRPTTARRRPPKIKDGARELTAKETAPATKRTVGIMRDGEDDDDEDEEDAENLLADQKRLGKATGSPAKSAGEAESKLVKDILSRQAEQEAASSTAPADEGKEGATDGDAKESGDGQQPQGSGIRIGARLSMRNRKGGKAGPAGGASGSSSMPAATSTGAVLSAEDVQRLRNAIQVLVQQTGPLGTCMDFIQEDVGQMSTELHRWEEECRKYERQLEEETERSQEVLRPLQAQLKELESQVNECQAKTSAMKAEIAKNEGKMSGILKLVATA